MQSQRYKMTITALGLLLLLSNSAPCNAGNAPGSRSSPMTKEFRNDDGCSQSIVVSSTDRSAHGNFRKSNRLRIASAATSVGIIPTETDELAASSMRIFPVGRGIAPAPPAGSESFFEVNGFQPIVGFGSGIGSDFLAFTVPRLIAEGHETLTLGSVIPATKNITANEINTAMAKARFSIGREV